MKKHHLNAFDYTKNIITTRIVSLVGTNLGLKAILETPLLYSKFPNRMNNYPI